MTPRLRPDENEELAARAAGYRLVAGVDEAGRGPLAGPVVAAAVVLPPGWRLEGLDDSKKLTPRRRERLYEALLGDPSVLAGVGSACVEEIDRMNILNATRLAMIRAVEAVPGGVDFCLIDGLPVRDFPLPQKAIVKGDARCLSIAAASILAKVTRDACMERLAKSFPQYGFEKHKGYGTAQHLAAIQQYGITIHHRRSFAPVAQMALPLDR